MRRYIAILLFAMILTASVVNLDYSIFYDMNAIKSHGYSIFLVFFWGYMLLSTINTPQEEEYI
jgi:hypothetical protein